MLIVPESANRERDMWCKRKLARPKLFWPRVILSVQEGKLLQGKQPEIDN
jgi:hypothetical protein